MQGWERATPQHQPREGKKEEKRKTVENKK